MEGASPTLGGFGRGECDFMRPQWSPSPRVSESPGELAKVRVPEPLPDLL